MRRFRPSGLSQPLPDHPADDPTLACVVPDRAISRSALGFSVLFETNDARIERAALEVLGPEHPSTTGEPDVRLRILRHHVTESPGWQPEEPIIREQLGMYSITASRASFVHGDSGRGVAAGFVSETVAAMPEFLRTPIIQAAFLMATRERVHGAIHCACLTKHGRSFMLRGEPGSGKSTTAYVALRAGFSLVGEDVVFPRWSESDGFTLQGLPWTMYLMPDAPRFFPELREVPTVERHNGETKLRIAVDDMFPSQLQPAAPLGPSVFIRRSDDGVTRLEQLDPNAAQRALMETSIEFERRAARDDGLWDAMLALPAYRLEIGSDPFSAVPFLERLVIGSG